MTPDFSPPRLHTPQEIIVTVALKFGLRSEQILGRSREEIIVTARYVSMWLVRHRLKMTLSQTAMVFDRDHSLIVHAINKINGLRRSRADIAAMIERFPTCTHDNPISRLDPMPVTVLR